MGSRKSCPLWTPAEGGSTEQEGVEHGFYYAFSDLRDRFQRGYDEAIIDEDDFVTIKVPSFYELSFNVTTVGLALSR